MSGLSDAHHFRKMVAGTCMVVSPLMLLAAWVLLPERHDTAAAQIVSVAEHTDAWFISSAFFLAAIVFALPAVLGLMHMLREREVSLGHVGGGLAMLGLIAYTGIVAIQGFVVWQMATAGDAAVMAALLDSLTDTAGIAIPFFGMGFAFPVGLACLAVGLYRAHAVQSWMAGCLMMAAVLMVVEALTMSNFIGIVAAAFALVGLGSIGRMVLAETDEEWERTPTVAGFAR